MREPTEWPLVDVMAVQEGNSPVDWFYLEGRKDGIAAEREAIVKWLNSNVPDVPQSYRDYDFLHWAAEQIEAGAHHKEQS